MSDLKCCNAPQLIDAPSGCFCMACGYDHGNQKQISALEADIVGYGASLEASSDVMSSTYAEELVMTPRLRG